MSRIGFVGTGHIAAPMARNLAQKDHNIVVTERSAEVSAALARDIGAKVSDPQGVLDQSDIVFLCLRPQQASAVMETLEFRSDHQIVSVMAGVNRATLEEFCAPATKFVQTIPLGFLESGGCPLAAFGNATLLAELFEPENPVVPVSGEAELNAHFAICALVPGILEVMAKSAAWLGTNTGNPDAAEFYTSQLMSGFLSALDRRSTGHLASERDALATEGTLSLQMVEAVRNGGVNKAVADALNAIENRLNG